MAIFTGKIEDAYYIKPDKSLIEIIYSQDSDVHQSHALFVDFDHPDFKDLLDEISLDQIEKNTKQRHKKQSKTFGNALNSAVSEYLEVELKSRKEKIEKELKDFRESWFKEREEEYTKKYGKSAEEHQKVMDKQQKEIEKQQKEIAEEWDKLKKIWSEAETSWDNAKKTEIKLKRAWDEVKVSEDSSKKLFEQAEASWDKAKEFENNLKNKHEKTLDNLEKVALNFETYLTEQAQKFKESFNVDKELSKEDIDNQYRQMIDHYEELQAQTKNLKENIGFNYPNYINDLLYRTTQKLIEGQEQKDIAGEIVKNIIQSNTVAALAAHKKIDSNLLEVVMDDESEAAKEELFKLKLAIFEMEEVKKNKNKEQKSKIRKAPTKLKVLAEFDKLNV
tara:strand:- start:10464 stop:11636 length:1173 start_codon:yes stop_codon:yes gene_type:complete